MGNQSAKVLLLGDGAVGKTSLLRRYTENEFEEDYIATIGANLKTKHIDDLDIELSIWDLYGQKSMSPGKHSSNYVGAEGAMIVFDSARKNTFEHVTRWIKDLYKVIGKVPIILVGNKKDLLVDFQKEENTRLKESNTDEFHRYMIENHYYKNIYTKEPSFVPVVSSDVKRWREENEDKLSDHWSFYRTSAKTGENVDKGFRKLAEYVKKNKIDFEY